MDCKRYYSPMFEVCNDDSCCLTSEMEGRAGGGGGIRYYTQEIKLS